MKTVLIEFRPEDVQHLLSIALVGDGVEALASIRQELVKRMEKALPRRCAPVFEAGCGPGQADAFARK